MKNYTEDIFYKTIKFNMRKIRLEHKETNPNLTTQVLSEMLGISYTWLRDIESKNTYNRPSLELMRVFCLTLNEPIERLFEPIPKHK